MPRKEQGWITFQSSSEERQILEEYCLRVQRTKTDVLRELVRGLADALEPAPVAEAEADLSDDTLGSPVASIDSIQVSARNLLKARIKQITRSGVSTEVMLEIAPNVNLISVITSASVDRLGLTEGKSVYAMIKSNNVMLAVSHASSSTTSFT